MYICVSCFIFVHAAVDLAELKGQVFPSRCWGGNHLAMGSEPPTCKETMAELLGIAQQKRLSFIKDPEQQWNAMWATMKNRILAQHVATIDFKLPHNNLLRVWSEIMKTMGTTSHQEAMMQYEEVIWPKANAWIKREIAGGHLLPAILQRLKESWLSDCREAKLRSLQTTGMTRPAPSTETSSQVEIAAVGELPTGLV